MSRSGSARGAGLDGYGSNRTRRPMDGRRGIAPPRVSISAGRSDAGSYWSSVRISPAFFRFSALITSA